MRLREYLELQVKNNKQLNEWAPSGNRWVDVGGKVHRSKGYYKDQHRYGPEWDTKLDKARQAFIEADKDDLLHGMWSNDPDYFTAGYCYKWCTGFQPDPERLNAEFGKIVRSKFKDELNILDVITEQDLLAAHKKWGYEKVEYSLFLAVSDYLDNHPDVLIVMWDDPNNFFGIGNYYGVDDHTTGIKYSGKVFEHYSEIIDRFSEDCLKFATSTGNRIHDFYEGLKRALNSSTEKASFGNRCVLDECDL